jgi:oxazoline/thiazoline dehydrogenase
MRFRFKPEVKVKECKEGELLFCTSLNEIKCKNVPQPIRKGMLALADWQKEEELLKVCLDHGLTDHFLFYYYLEIIKQNNLLSYAVFDKNVPFIIIEPKKGLFDLRGIEINKKSRYQLSEFCYMRFTAEQILTLETPLAPVVGKLVHPKCLPLLQALSKDQTPDELLRNFPEYSEDWIHSFISLLLEINILKEVSGADNFALEQWEFHDLLFHSLSRNGRHANPYGGLYPFTERIPPLPPHKAPMTSEEVSLYSPSLQELKEKDFPLTSILEKRKSIREHGDAHPITAKQLGEFLFRTARVKDTFKTERGELTHRPYPSGGAIYELEIYPLVRLCEGIEKGFYHYQPEKHSLCLLPCEEEKLNRFLQDAAHSTGMRAYPQILFVITSRFRRMSWKYRSMSYATTLKNVGTLYQTMYLVATSMNLAPCAIGAGDSDLFSQTAKTDYYEETSVGEFMLGSKLLLTSK